MLYISAIAAAVLAALHIQLSLQVISLRRSLKVSIGDGGHESLQRAMRAQGNFSEYTPIALILLAVLEFNQAPWWIVAILATTFALGRFLHPAGIRNAQASFRPRVLGMQLTLFSILGLAVANMVWLGWLSFVK